MTVLSYNFTMSKGIVYESLGEKTYNEIKEMILRGELKAGERLGYKDMVARLNVSQTPIKEAFTRLEKEGFVFTIHHRGTMVNELSKTDILEMFQIRVALESLAISLAIPHIKQSDIDSLNKINTQFKEANDRKNMKKVTEKDFQFHETIYKLSENKRLYNLVNYSNVHLLSIAEMSNDFFGNSTRYYIDHNNIIEKIENRDVDGAIQVLHNHLSYAVKQVVESNMVN